MDGSAGSLRMIKGCSIIAGGTALVTILFALVGQAELMITALAVIAVVMVVMSPLTLLFDRVQLAYPLLFGGVAVIGGACLGYFIANISSFV